MSNNPMEQNPMFGIISGINAVEGFDPTQVAVEYDSFDGSKITGLPVAMQIAWFRLKYPEGRIAVTADVGANKDCIVARARIYKQYTDPVDQFLAEASASRSYSEKNPGIPPREWAQTAAIGIALRNAGFGLQFKVAGEPATPSGNELLPAGGKSGLPAAPERTETTAAAEAPAAVMPEPPIDPLEAARQMVCPLKNKYAGRTLGEIVALDKGFITWLATKYSGTEHPELAVAARLLCEHALSQSA